MNIAIAGFGLEGKASYQYWNTPENQLTIVDERQNIDDLPDGAKTIVGDSAFDQLRGFDLVVRTASLNPAKLKLNSKIWSATNEFFEKCPAPIIGVTGTKGKGTTSSMIASILRADGKTVHLVGNIGVSALTELSQIEPQHIVVFELSSFQLWDLIKSPQTAVVLKVEADHLDVHKGMEDYVAAKSNIRKFQSDTDVCFYHPTNVVSQQIATMLPGAKRYGIRDDGAVYVEAGMFCVDGDTICATEAVTLPGEHNIENACAAISAALPYISSNDVVETGLQAFEGLPHRLKFVSEKNGIRYYDDSIATTPGSAIAALLSFQAPKVIILGGSDKGADYSELIDECKTTNAKVVVIGEVGEA